MATGAALCDYAVAVYAAPGVAQHCIELQDQQGIDVCLLLCGAWCAARGLALDDAATAALDTRCADWRREVVQPLRRQRRLWRQLPARREDYAAIKEIELAAERLQLQRLEALGKRIARPARGAAPRSLLRDNLRALWRRCGADDAQLASTCARLEALLPG